MKRVGAAGANLGLSIPFVAAMEATLVSAGMKASRAGTRIRTALTRMSGNIEGFAQLTNTSFQEFSDLLERDAEAAIQLVLKSLSNYGDSVSRQAKTTELFGRVAGFAITTLANNYDELAVSIDIANREMELGLSLIMN